MRGTKRIIPATPQISPPTIKAIMATKGFIDTFEPTILGDIKFPSRNCTTAKTMTTKTGVKRESPSSRAKSKGGKAPIIIPMYGITANNDAKTPKKMACSNPIINSPVVFNMAKIPITERSPTK